MWNIFKVYMCQTYFTPCSSVSFVSFEYVNDGWAGFTCEIFWILWGILLEFIFSEFHEKKVGNKKKITIKTNRFPSSRTGT